MSPIVSFCRRPVVQTVPAGSLCISKFLFLFFPGVDSFSQGVSTRFPFSAVASTNDSRGRCCPDV